eukprot:4829764-Heterocapsa_arctica.AAC.1
MKPSIKQYAREVLNWHPNQLQVINSGKFSLAQRSILWYTNLAGGAKEPEFNPEQLIGKGWWPKGNINKHEIIATWNNDEINSINVSNYLRDNTSVSSHEPDRLTPNNGKTRWRVVLGVAFDQARIEGFQKSINKDSTDKIKVFQGRDPRNSMLPLMTVTRDYQNNG